MASKHGNEVLIVGGRGEFGEFLKHDILPILEPENVATIERETSPQEQASLLQVSRHIVLATPLAGYAELACGLVYRFRSLRQPTTFWLIPSVQAGVWRAVTATLEIVANPILSAVFVHPMYGPNGFRATEPEARTFQNILTATHEGSHHSLTNELQEFSKAFQENFNIETTMAFDPEEHDRLTAYSQGLSYCVGHLMFEQSEFDRLVKERMPELHQSFHANHDLILDFLRINAYMPQVIATFYDALRQTNRRTFEDVLSAFRQADMALNRGSDSLIPTKWYERLRASASNLE